MVWDIRQGQCIAHKVLSHVYDIDEHIFEPIISKGDYGDIGDLADDYLDWVYIDKKMKPNWWPVKEPVRAH